VSSAKYFSESVEIYVDLDEWDTEELVAELRSRGEEISASSGVSTERMIQNLFLAYVSKDVRLFDMELKTLFKEVLGERA